MCVYVLGGGVTLEHVPNVCAFGSMRAALKL